jgi:tetratricopeptide (TPR) repeat protein
MKSWVTASRNVVGFAPIKDLLRRIGYTPMSDGEWVGVSVLLPDEQAVAQARARASLTEGARIFEQIRFFKTNRVVRHFIKTGRALVGRAGALDVHVARAELLDEGSRVFLDTLARSVAGVTVSLHTGDSAEVIETPYVPSAREARIERLVAQPTRLVADDRAFLIDQAKLYLNCGDAWTCDRILERLRADELDPEIAFLSGLTCSLQMRTIESEFYYRRTLGDDSPSRAAWTCTALAMFYLRDHPPYLHSPAHALELIEQGHHLLEQAQGSHDLEWDVAFNRNTYAYFLTRRGDVQGAIDLLDRNIEALGSQPPATQPDQLKRFLIFKSLYLFNLSMCYRRLGRIPEALDICAELVTIDPNYPEYQMEVALCHLTQGDHRTALEWLTRAASLDPTIAEIHSNMGICWQELGGPARSLDCFREARCLDRGRPDLDYDYAYALSELNRYPECLRVLDEIDLARTSPAQYEDILSLKAEALANLGRAGEAVTLLTSALDSVSPGDKLRHNIAQLTALEASSDGVTGTAP